MAYSIEYILASNRYQFLVVKLYLLFLLRLFLNVFLTTGVAVPLHCGSVHLTLTGTSSVCTTEPVVWLDVNDVARGLLACE